MDEIFRTVMRHERTLTRWSTQLCKDWRKQRKTNKRLTRAVVALALGIIYEDYNLYKSDQRIKALEEKLAQTPVEEVKENKDEE